MTSSHFSPPSPPLPHTPSYSVHLPSFTFVLVSPSFTIALAVTSLTLSSYLTIHLPRHDFLPHLQSPSLISFLTFTSTISHLPSPPSPPPARTPSPVSPSLTLAHVHTVIISTCTLTPAFSPPFPQVLILSLFYPQSSILLSSSPATLKSAWTYFDR